MMRRHLFIALAACFATLAAGLLAYQWTSLPTTLRIAVGPPGSDDARLVLAAAQHLARERHGIRLRVLPTEGVAASAQAIEDGKAQLAIVRTDVAMPTKAQTVAIMHRDAALLLTTPQTGIAKVSGLWGRNIGILRGNPVDETLLRTILAQYEVPADSVPVVHLAGPSEVEAAFTLNRVDAVLVVGTVTSRAVAETVAAVAQAGGTPPVFVPVGEADAIELRLPAYESLEIVRGTFGGTPPRPAETVETLGVSHRLVALETLDDRVVSELTRLIFAIRPALSTEIPLANRIEGPELSKSAALPIHSGAAAYYEGEIQTFFERYGDWFYVALFGLSILGSGAAAFASRAANRSRARNIALLGELLAIVRSARDARSEDEIDALERRADAILATALAKAGGGGIDSSGVAAFTLGLDQAQRALTERRMILLAHPPLSQAAE
jgi:TRAP transporter TAXI family solute receptor